MNSLRGLRPLRARSASAACNRSVRLIIGYKLLKAAAWLVIAAVLWVLLLRGAGGALEALAHRLANHAASAWSTQLANLLIRAAEPGHVRIAALALTLDGILSLVEGIALVRRWRWGPWLVIGATASLLPFEIAALIRHAAAGRFALLAINAAIVLVLWQERARASEAHSEQRDR